MQRVRPLLQNSTVLCDTPSFLLNFKTLPHSKAASRNAALMLSSSSFIAFALNGSISHIQLLSIMHYYSCFFNARKHIFPKFHKRPACFVYNKHIYKHGFTQPEFPNMQKLIPLSAVADNLGIKPETLRRKVRTGLISAYKIGKSWHFTESSIDAFLNSCLSSTPQEQRQSPGNGLHS